MEIRRETNVTVLEQPFCRRQDISRGASPWCPTPYVLVNFGQIMKVPSKTGEGLRSLRMLVLQMDAGYLLPLGAVDRN